jgi:hypothetical protein
MFRIRIRIDLLLNTGTPIFDPDPVPVAIKLLKWNVTCDLLAVNFTYLLF